VVEAEVNRTIYTVSYCIVWLTVFVNLEVPERWGEAKALECMLAFEEGPFKINFEKTR
jgi:hypothetical protein